MHKYGIDNCVVYESETEIPLDVLPSLGAANLSKLPSDDVMTLDRTDTLQYLADNYVHVQVSGLLPSSNIRKIDSNLSFVLFNKELGLFSSAESTNIKPPLKPTSTLKQTAGKLRTLDLQLAVRSTQQRRSVKIQESFSEDTATCGAIPVNFSCYLDPTTQCCSLFSSLQAPFWSYIQFVTKSGKEMKVIDGSALEMRSYFDEKCFLPILMLSAGSVDHNHLSASLKDHNLLENGLQFTPVPNLGVITNPHEILKAPRLPIVRYAKRRYGYYHYGQQKMNDSGWGCAYRSLQTLFSWFYLNGSTTTEPPTHELIQKTLVKIGDKQKDFIGSRQWIGSFEVQFVLNELLGIDCKTINVESGGELEGKIPELIDHFESVGSPVMIGGGVLAHTIVGVAFDDATREGRFLILDPHYTGHHNIQGIKDKGVYWRDGDFWNKEAYYNMCLPQLL